MFYLATFFNITEYIYILPLSLQLFVITRNMINEIAIVTQYFAIISSREVACGTIRGCATNKNNYHFNVVCI